MCVRLIRFLPTTPHLFSVIIFASIYPSPGQFIVYSPCISYALQITPLIRLPLGIMVEWDPGLVPSVFLSEFRGALGMNAAICLLSRAKFAAWKHLSEET